MPTPRRSKPTTKKAAPPKRASTKKTPTSSKNAYNPYYKEFMQI